MSVLICQICGKTLAECCDIFEPLIDEDGNDAGVACGDCAAKLEFEETEGE